MKAMVAPGSIFEELGLNYIGPIDGHNIKQLIDVIGNLKDFDGPVIGCVNKLDKLSSAPERMAKAIDALQSRYAFEKILTLSALRKLHMDLLHQEICDAMPAGEAQFPVDIVTEHDDAFLIQEMGPTMYSQSLLRGG